MSGYKNLVPQPTDRISVSQGDFLGNFGIIETGDSHDHVSLLASDEDERMKHALVKLKDQTTNLPYATLADEGAIYTKVVGGQDDLYYKHFNNGPEVKLSSGGTTGGSILASFFATWTAASGILTLQYQQNIAAINSSGGTFTVTFTRALSSANYVVMLQDVTTSVFTDTNLAPQITEGSLTTVNFQFYHASPGGTADGIFCMVVG